MTTQEELKEMYDKLSDWDKFRVSNYIWETIQLPLITESLKKEGLL